MKIILVQRFFPNYREGLFDRLAQNSNFKLICHPKSYGKIIIPNNLPSKSYRINAFSVRIKKDIVLFPFLFIRLLIEKPEIIVTEGGRNTINNLIVYIYASIFKKKFIIWDLGRGYMKENNDSNIFIQLYLKLQCYLLNKTYKIFTYNTVNIDYFKRIVPDKEVIALGNTIDTNKILLLKENVQKQNDIPQEILNKERIFLYIGALNEMKKVHLLGDILEPCENYGLVIIGDGDETYKKKLKKKLENVNCAMLGYKSLDQLTYYYEISDLVILPGLGGLTIPQSYMFETPVLCSNADGTEEEIVNNWENGFVFTNVKEASNFLKNTTKTQLSEMGKKGFNMVSQKFTIENYVKNFINSLA